VSDIIEITIARRNMKGVYEKPSPEKFCGFISYYGADNKLTFRRGLSESEAMMEHWVSRIEIALDNLRVIE
jgi:hypothetical protein